MVAINFYHLSKSPLEKALAKLLEKIIDIEKRAVVSSDTAEHLAVLDSALWTYSQSAFLPHGTLEIGYSEHQPIFLTTQMENPNNASFLIVTEGSFIQDFSIFERCFDIFNGLDSECVENARIRWKKYKQQGYKLTYWQQNTDGNWEQKNT